MNFSTFRRSLLRIAMVISLASACMPLLAGAQQIKPTLTVQKKLAELEASSGGRIGVSAIDTASNQRIQYRAEERFPMGCTSKVIGVAAILKKSMADNSLLQQKVIYTKKDLADWSPITKNHLADGMTIEELGAAAISYSDNTAMNLLAEKLGGPQAINAFARSTGDNFFRVDHEWPEIAASGGPDNVYDSSTPAAMEKIFQQIVIGNVLAAPQREELVTWLKNNTTGDARIRAGVPKAWIVGDKTGTGSSYGSTNDIGIIWPSKCAPIVVAIYYTNNKKDATKREDIVASVTRSLINEFAQNNQCIKS
jgi:beta-lactamase class A